MTPAKTAYVLIISMLGVLAPSAGAALTATVDCQLSRDDFNTLQVLKHQSSTAFGRTAVDISCSLEDTPPTSPPRRIAEAKMSLSASASFQDLNWLPYELPRHWEPEVYSTFALEWDLWGRSRKWLDTEGDSEILRRGDSRGELTAAFDLRTAGPPRPGFLLVFTESFALTLNGIYRFPISVGPHSFSPPTGSGHGGFFSAAFPVQLGRTLPFQMDLLADLSGISPAYGGADIGGGEFSRNMVLVAAAELDGTPAPLGPVPEPAPILLLASALVLTLGVQKRKPRRN